MNLLERLTDQLNSLVPFLGLAHPPIHSLLRKHQGTWIVAQQRKSVPETFQIFELQITHGAYLLGYSYSEAFLADLVREVYRSLPTMLPDDKVIPFQELKKIRSRRELSESMIDREVASLFFQSMEKIIEYYERKLKLEWKPEWKTKAVEAALIRNCIIHNGAIVDERLAAHSGKFRKGQAVHLRQVDVHLFGITLRDIARSLHSQADKRYFSRSRGQSSPSQAL